MNRWLLLRRLRGPAFLLLVGITALLNQWDVLSFGRSWPLYLILFGVMSLGERAALARADLDAYDPLTGQPKPINYSGYGNAGFSGQAATTGEAPGTSIIPTNGPGSSLATDLPSHNSGEGRL